VATPKNTTGVGMFNFLTLVIRRFSGAVKVLAFSAALVLFGAQVSLAAGFQDDVGSKTEIFLKDIPGVGSVLNNLKLSRLANTKMVSVTTTPETISGFVNFLAMRWNFLVFKSGTNTYFALEPVNAQGKPRTPKLSDFVKAPGIELTDMLTFDRVVWVVAGRTIELEQKNLPAPAKAMFKPYFGNDTFGVELGQGLTFMAMADLGKAKPLKDAIQAIGGQSTNVLFKAQLETSLLDSLIQGQAPSVTAKFQASLPPIQPNIGGKVKLPRMTLGLVAELEPTEGNVKFGYVAEVAEIPYAYPNIAKKRISTAKTAMSLEVAMALQGGKPVFSISSTIFKGDDGRFQKAFGLPFLDLQDYTMEFEIKPDAVAIGIGAGGRFYDNNITLFAAVQVPAATAGIPIPD